MFNIYLYFVFCINVFYSQYFLIIRSKHLGLQVYVVAIGALPIEESPKFTSLKVNSEDKVLNVMTHAYSYKNGDWTILMDANEVLSFPQSAVLNLTMKQTLIKIGQEPYGFNAVAVSTFFMQDQDGSNFSNELPFKIFTLRAWDVGDCKNEELWPAVDTLKHRVKIWRHGESRVSISWLKTATNTRIISDVNFIGMNVYPFHALSLRFHLQFTHPYTYLDEDLRRMYILESSIGYMAEDRMSVAVKEYLY